MKQSRLIICSLALSLGIACLGAPNAIAQGGALPAGVVVPFAGPVSNIPPGWLPCDGAVVSNVDFPGLFSAIGEAHGDGQDGPGGTLFNLPDYRGAFLRGVDHTAGRDPEADTREAMNLGGNTGNNVGSVQGDATALPNTDFMTDSAGSHAHTLDSSGNHVHNINSAGQHSHFIGTILVPGGANGDGNGSPRFSSPSTRSTNSAGNHSHSMNAAGDHTHSMDSAGDHSHAVSGGDAETRPVNAYVNWIIKAETTAPGQSGDDDEEDDDDEN